VTTFWYPTTTVDGSTTWVPATFTQSFDSNIGQGPPPGSGTIALVVETLVVQDPSKSYSDHGFYGTYVAFVLSMFAVNAIIVGLVLTCALGNLAHALITGGPVRVRREVTSWLGLRHHLLHRYT
jgi:hypothetical protein